MKKLILSALVVLCTGVAAFAQEPEKLKGDESFVILSTKRIQTMEKELTEMANRGYHVLYGAPTNQVDMALLMDRNASGRANFEYKILATSRISTMQKELNEAGAAGYRLLPRTIIFKNGFLTAELTMIVERDPSLNSTYEYDLVESIKETSLHKLIDASIARGFAPMTMITLGKNIVVMEKTASKP